jgi:hypothetical protein
MKPGHEGGGGRDKGGTKEGERRGMRRNKGMTREERGNFPVTCFFSNICIFFNNFSGGGMLSTFGKLSEALQFGYPEFFWDEKKFTFRGKKSAQRLAFLPSFASLFFLLPFLSSFLRSPPSSHLLPPFRLVPLLFLTVN